MFTLTRLLATLGALVVVPTISYVLGETMEPTSSPPPPAAQQMPQVQPMMTPQDEGMMPRMISPRPRMMEERDDIDLPDVNEDEFQKEMEERKKEQQRRGLQMMKQGISRIHQPIKMMQTQIQKLESQKIAVPSEMKEFLSTIQEAVKAVQGAPTFEDAEEFMEVLQNARQDFEDHFETLQKLGNWKRITTKATSEIRRLEATLKRAQSNAKRKGVLDMTEALNELSDVVISMKAAFEKAKALIAEGNAEEALETMENNFFEAVEGSEDILRTLEILKDLGGHLRRAPQELKKYKSDISRLKRRGVDTSKADALITQMERKLSEVKTLAAAKPIDTEALVDAIDDGSKLIEEFENVRDTLSGAGPDSDALFDVNEKAIPKFELPSVP